MIATRSSKFTRPLQYLALIGFMIFLAFPLIFLSSPPSRRSARSPPPIPACCRRDCTGRTSATRSRKMRLWTSARNSLMVALATVVLVILLAMPAAYALARFRTRLRGVATGWILLSQVFPFILIVIPLFIVLRNLHLIDTLWGLVLVYTVWSLPFALWMLQGYIAGIPNELEEAASMDGA